MATLCLCSQCCERLLSNWEFLYIYGFLILIFSKHRCLFARLIKVQNTQHGVCIHSSILRSCGNFSWRPFVQRNRILLPKLFWPTVRKNCSSDREELLKFEAEGQEFANFLRSHEKFIQTVQAQYNFWNKMLF